MVHEEQPIFRLASANDREAVLHFYHYMIDAMAGTEFDAYWKRDVHPSDGYLTNALMHEQLLIGLLDDEIVCALVLDHDGAPGYETIPWHVDADSNEVGIYHVVATHPNYHGRGLAKALINASISLAQNRGYKALRLDTFPENLRSHGLYEACGFTRLGEFTLHYAELGPTSFIIYELPLI